MKKKSILLTLTAVVLAMAIGVGGTIAYFTSTTDDVKNTFTVGNVAITLDEAKVTYADDVWTAGSERVTTNTYENVYPGAHLPKDPTIHVAADSQDAYVAMKVVISKAAAWKALAEDHASLNDLETVFEGYKEADWTKIAATEQGDNLVYVYMWEQGKVSANADLTLFTAMNIPAELSSEEIETLDGFTVTATGYAVQAQGVTAETAKAELLKLAGLGA